MSLGTTLRVGFALLALSMASACAQRQLDKKPELAQEHGYYVSQDEAIARGGVGGYVDVPSNTERASLKETTQQAGVAVEEPVPPEPQQPVAEQPVEKKADTVAVLKDQPKVIHFDVGDSAIPDDSKPVLNQIATQLKDAGDVTVKVEGFADKLGTVEGNKQLSEERADSVKDYLESKGAPSDQLDVAFYGDEKASSPDANADDRKVILSIG